MGLFINTETDQSRASRGQKISPDARIRLWSASRRLPQTPGCWPGSGHQAVSSAIPGSLRCGAGRSRACPWDLCRPLPGMVTRAGVGRCGWWSHRCGPCSAWPPCASSLAVVTGAHRWRRGPHPWGVVWEVASPMYSVCSSGPVQAGLLASQQLSCLGPVLSFIRGSP